MRHYSYRTEKAYVHWIKRCIFFHNKRHPQEMAESEIAAFLSSLASADHVSAATQNQALNALLFLYNEVLKKKIGMVQGVVRAKRPRRLPVVLTKDEVKKILGNLTGTSWLMAIILYRTGLRLMECCRLRIKDVDFSRNQIIVRSGKGDKDRYTMLPTAVREPLLRHLQMLEGGCDIRTVQELLGHKDVSTTMIYTRVLNRGGSGVVSPVDSLLK
jgi:site-specific recombinase XerD